MFHKLVDKVYVINLEKSKDRREGIAAELHRLGCKFEFFKTIDGRKENVKFHKNEIMAHEEGWNQGSAGLVYTTINIIKEAKEKGYKSILIMEDDLVFYPNAYVNVVEALKRLPASWKLFHFAIQNIKSPTPYGLKAIRINAGWSCQAYIIKEELYDEYLEYLELVDRPIDSVTSDFLHPQGFAYAPTSKIIKTVPNVSTIRGEFISLIKKVESLRLKKI
jgi:GR25 family glycosyltransferase involved in LPS biosynthesis